MTTDSEPESVPESAAPESFLDTTELDASAVAAPSWIPIGDLDLQLGAASLWKNPRTATGLDADSMAALRSSIEDGTRQELGEGDGPGSILLGIKEPLKVIQVIEPGGAVRILVIDGQRRYLASKAIGNDDALVPVVYIEPEPVMLTKELVTRLLMIALDTVATRAGLGSYELLDSARRLRDGGCKLAEIALRIGRSESWVSKMIKAYDAAHTSLVLSWRRGAVTDEQFKDLAGLSEQDVKEVISAREQGDLAGARALAKEAKAKAGAKADTPTELNEDAPPKPARTVRGPQQELPGTKPKPPSRAVMDDFLSMPAKVPVTSDYVKGLFDGALYATGQKDPKTFAPAWGAYLTRHARASVGAKEVKAKPDEKPAKARSSKK